MQDKLSHATSIPNAGRLAAAERKGRGILLTAAQAATEVFGVSERTFHTLRSEPWMPPAIVIGPRLVRWSRAELEAAVERMPRQATAETYEPGQLRRGRIEAMKRCRAE